MCIGMPMTICLVDRLERTCGLGPGCIVVARPGWSGSTGQGGVVAQARVKWQRRAMVEWQFKAGWNGSSEQGVVAAQSRLEWQLRAVCGGSSGQVGVAARGRLEWQLRAEWSGSA